MFKKRKLKPIIIWVSTFLILAVFLGPKIYQIFKTNMELGKRVDALKKELEELGAENEELKNFIANFEKEFYIEKEAKKRLNLKKPGEKVVVIIEEVEETGGKIKEKTSWFKQLWQKIKENWKLRQ